MYLTYLDLFQFLAEDLNCQLSVKGAAVYINTDASGLSVETIAGTIEGLLYSQEYKRTVEVKEDNLIILS